MTNKSPFSSDIPEINPAKVIENMRKEGIEKTLGAQENILYIEHRQIRMYTVEDWKIYIWSDSRGSENSIFISKEYVGKNHTVSWYKARKIVAENILKVPNQRDFIERCVLGKVTPESLTQ